VAAVAAGDKRPYALVALVALCAHLTALLGGFVWLDHSHLEEGLALARAGDWLPVFARGFAGTGFYRPMMSVALSLDAAFGGAVWLYHASSLMWHAAAAVLVAPAAESLGLSRRAAVLAALLFAVHPATSLVAAAIAFRSEAMITAALLALIVWHRRGRAVPAALAVLFGALTKETALVLAPLFILALELDAPRAPALRWRLWAAEATAMAAAVALRLAFAPTWRAAFVPLSPGEAVGTRLATLARSALLVLAPLDRTICDASSVSGPWTGRALLGLAVLAGVALLGWKRRGPALLLAMALLPSLDLVPIMRWWSPHYLYVPLAFAAMLAAERVVALGRRAELAAVLVMVALGAVTLRDDLRFRTDEALWAPEAAANPACREAHFYLGERALAARRFDEAAAHWASALAVTPGVLSYVDRAATLQNLGVTRLGQQRVPEAGLAFRQALALVTDEPARRKLTHNLAAAELRAGNAAEAARLLEAEAGRADALPESLFVRARALHQLGREAEAGALVRRLQQPAN
jgi:tetratricopeptide (TPR) repeat protein